MIKRLCQAELHRYDPSDPSRYTVTVRWEDRSLLVSRKLEGWHIRRRYLGTIMEVNLDTKQIRYISGMFPQ